MLEFNHLINIVCAVPFGWMYLRERHLMTEIKTLQAATKLTLPPAPPMLAPEIPPDFCVNVNDPFSILQECFAPVRIRETIKIKTRTVLEVRKISHDYEVERLRSLLVLSVFVLLSLLLILLLVSCGNKRAAKKQKELDRKMVQFSSELKKLHKTSQDEINRRNGMIRQLQEENTRASEAARATEAAEHQANQCIARQEDEIRQYCTRQEQLVQQLGDLQADNTRLSQTLQASTQPLFPIQSNVEGVHAELSFTVPEFTAGKNTSSDPIRISGIGDAEILVSRQTPHGIVCSDNVADEELQDDTKCDDSTQDIAEVESNNNKDYDTKSSSDIASSQGNCMTTENKQNQEIQNTLQIPAKQESKDELRVDLPKLVDDALMVPTYFESKRGPTSRIRQWNRRNRAEYNKNRSRAEQRIRLDTRTSLEFMVGEGDDSDSQVQYPVFVQTCIDRGQKRHFSYEEFLHQHRVQPSPLRPATQPHADTQRYSLDTMLDLNHRMSGARSDTQPSNHGFSIPPSGPRQDSIQNSYSGRGFGVSYQQSSVSGPTSHGINRTQQISQAINTSRSPMSSYASPASIPISTTMEQYRSSSLLMASIQPPRAGSSNHLGPPLAFAQTREHEIPVGYSQSITHPPTQRRDPFDPPPMFAQNRMHKF